MPDVTRSDSQRSDASHKPRVSFNRDVHVKRIGREGVVSALAGDGEGHLVPLPVRRERPGRLSRRQLEQEAEEILRQADRIQCRPTLSPAIGGTKFNTLPPRPRQKQSSHPPASSIFNSLGRKKKPPEGSSSVKLKRRFSNPDNSWGTSYNNSSPERGRSSPEGPPNPRRRLNRSVSDVGQRADKKDKERTSIFGTLDRIRKKKKKPPVLMVTPPERDREREEIVPPVRKKKQLSPIIEMSPKVEGADPFGFAPTGGSGSVVYAEVVARPNGGKTTVHTTVPADPSSRLDLHPVSEEDEGVDMGHRGVQSRRFTYENDILRSTSPKEYTVDIKRELDSTPKRKNDDIREDRIINMLRSRSNPLLDEDLVGGYRREVRTERVVRRVEGVDDPDGRGRADGMDFNSRRRSSKDFIEEEVPLKTSYFGDAGKIHSYDDLDRIKYQEPIRAWTPPIETSLIDSNNLSYRRDRLESRLTNHKRRFPSSAHENKSYRDDRVKTDLRKEFLISQLNDDKEKGYFEKKIATEIDTHHRQQLKNKDVFSDSGIEMSDYRKDPSKDVATLNRRNAETTRIIRTETSRTKSTPVLNKVDYHSDGERRYKGDISKKFIEEERRRRDVIPESSTLVKSYSKPSKEEQKTTVKKEEKTTKEKKKEKLTRMDKVKQLMFGSKDSKKHKKKKKQGEEEEDLLRTRYTEYKGSDVSVNSSPVAHRRRQTSSSEVDDRTDQELEFYGSRQRLATPSPRPSEAHTEETWFKSLTRRNKHAKGDRKQRLVNGEASEQKHLRFFGDSDRESHKSARVASPSSRLRDSSPNPHLLQVPPHRHGRRHLAGDSSAESTTEGDSSHQSQKSVVYLHAATVGDIPGSRRLHRSVVGGGRRSVSREELSSNSEVLTPQARTLSRSVSVLAPWRPRHNRQEVTYDGDGKPPRAPKARKPAVEKSAEKHKKSSSRELRKSKENIADYHGDSRRGSNESIFNEHKKSRGNLVFVGKRESRDEVDRKIENGSTMARSHHTIDRSHHSKDKSRDLARSVSIPKDSRVSSGWFKGKSTKAK